MSARTLAAYPAALDCNAPFLAETSRPSALAAGLRLFFSPVAGRCVLAPADDMWPGLSIGGAGGGMHAFLVNHHRAYALPGLRAVFYSSGLGRWILTESGKGTAEPQCYTVPGGGAVEGDGYWTLAGMGDTYSPTQGIVATPAGAYASDPANHAAPALAWLWDQVWTGPAHFPSSAALAEGVEFTFAGTGTSTAATLVVRGPVSRTTVYVSEIAAWR